MIGLVACSTQKLSQRAPARQLYCSPLFKKALAYAETCSTHVYVLSAKLGLVELDTVTAPYDQRLGSKKERRAWAHRVASLLVDRHGRAVDYLLLAGQDYAEPLAVALWTCDGFREDGWTGVPRDRILQPLAGMSVGKRLQWLNEKLAHNREERLG